MQRHLLIHTPHRATSWPSHLDSVSPLYRALAHRWANNPKLADIAFNFTDAGTGQVEQEWDPTRGKFEEPPADAPQE